MPSYLPEGQKTLFEERKWVGQFYVPEDSGNMLFGTLEFVPDDGIFLKYTSNSFSLLQEADVLHGILETGEKCTLVGSFKRQSLSDSLEYPIYRGYTSFRYILIGGHYKKNELFKQASFNLTGLSDYFSIDNLQNGIEPCSENIELEFGSVKFEVKSDMDNLLENFNTNIYHGNATAKHELNKKIIELNKQYGGQISTVKNQRVQAVFSFNCGKMVEDIYEYITQLADLFALLMFHPVYPLFIELKNSDNSCILYPSFVIEKKTQSLSMPPLIRHKMPIRSDNLNTPKVITKWLEIAKEYLLLNTLIQFETGVNNINSCSSEIIIYASIFEGISYDEKTKDNKYEYPINKHASERLRDILEIIRNKCSAKDLNALVSDVRNEIAHKGKPKKVTKKLSLNDLKIISVCMQLVCIGYIFNKLGIKEKLVDNYQNYFVQTRILPKMPSPEYSVPLIKI